MENSPGTAGSQASTGAWGQPSSGDRPDPAFPKEAEAAEEEHHWPTAMKSLGTPPPPVDKFQCSLAMECPQPTKAGTAAGPHRMNHLHGAHLAIHTQEDVVVQKT